MPPALPASKPATSTPSAIAVGSCVLSFGLLQRHHATSNIALFIRPPRRRRCLQVPPRKVCHKSPLPSSSFTHTTHRAYRNPKPAWRLRGRGGVRRRPFSNALSTCRMRTPHPYVRMLRRERCETESPPTFSGSLGVRSSPLR